ncbi:S8 family serine peptidase [Deinococcus peraridilitoris]|uniref:Subtilisin-like serine protease n=1 Tax=Deinococcus peraridilitoris (strain DSM 19664 / LMG 22246 / CIP 109416 / KR-200) TaxID=937777 RepID=K9ZXQ9_DEIPD|nr:S8 family serine peptidase [Deinococcus peraridilitoris]AFZ66381.1 subtilisin-like serine protease [Deinococcus peraridilitoris DSM 19664]
MKKYATLGTSLALVLAACGTNTPSNTSLHDSARSAGSQPIQAQAVSTLTECQALYGNQTSGVRVDSGLRYGSVVTLILSFADDASKGRAVDWMDANLDVDPGEGLGAFDHLPMVAVKTLVTPELVERLQANLPGLVSVYQDAPLRYLLAESVAYIKADAARATYGVSGKGVGVAVIDSGIDASHPDLQVGQNVGRNVKIVGPITDVGVGGYLYADLPNTDTTSGHGTHVASTIAGSGAASRGSARVRTGVAPGATLIGIGAGDGISILYALQGFDFALNPDNREKYNIRVISNSWGSSGDFAPYNPINLASKRAYDQGVVVAFAAGNEGPGANTLNPYSASPCVISVAAGDKQGNLANFSSRGISGDALVHPDITAPGVRISAARASTGAIVLPDTDNPLYSTISGTSMATPHISGVVALMLEANPALKLDSILSIFKKTASPMYYTSGGVTKQRELWEVGYGYVNANAAVREAVKSNTSKYTLSTSDLPSWSGTVEPALCAPLLDCAVNARDTHTLSVPSGTSALRVNTDWGNPAYDLDLYVYDPSGKLVASSTQGASVSEEVSIPSPVAGEWKVVLEGYLNASTSYTGTAAVDQVVRK